MSSCCNTFEELELKCERQRVEIVRLHAKNKEMRKELSEANTLLDKYINPQVMKEVREWARMQDPGGSE